MAFKRMTQEERNRRWREGKTRSYIKKGKWIVQELNDGKLHKVEIFYRESYGNFSVESKPYTVMTLLVDGRRELGVKLDPNNCVKLVEFDWYATPYGIKPEDSDNGTESEDGSKGDCNNG